MASSPNSTNNRLAGVAAIAVGGVTYMLAGDLVYSPGSVTRETLVGQSGVDGYKEMPRAPFISGTFRDSNGLTVADFNAMTSVNISAQLANGKNVTGSNMWCTDAQEVKTQEGTFDLKFEGIQNSVVETGSTSTPVSSSS